jgi:hypothetical protein
MEVLLNPGPLAATGSTPFAKSSGSTNEPGTGAEPRGLGALGQPAGLQLARSETAYFRNNTAVAGMTFKGALTIDLEKAFNAVSTDGTALRPVRFELYRSPQDGSWTALSKEFGAWHLYDSNALTGRGEAGFREVENALRREISSRLADPY